MKRNAVLSLSLFIITSLSIIANDSQELVRLKDGQQQQMLGALAASKKQRADGMRELHAVHVHHTLGDLQLMHDGNGYVVKDKKGEHRVAKHGLDHLLKTMPASALPKFQQNGYVEVKRMSDGEYKLISHVRGDGGGIFGANAGFFAGKLLVYGVAHGTIGLISVGANVVVPGSSGAVFVTLEKTFAPTIEWYSNVAAIGLGVAGGTVTGPV